MDTMTTAREAGREHFIRTLSLINTLRDYGTSTDADAPPRFEGLRSDAHRILSDPEVGRPLVYSWALVFADTVRLLNRFREEDLRTGASEKELQRVQHTADQALAALAGRLNQLAESVL